MSSNDADRLRKLEHFETELRVVRDPIVRSSLKQEASAWAEHTLPQVEEQMAAKRSEFTRQHNNWFGEHEPGSDFIPRIIPDHEYKARVGALGARLMEIFEAAFSGWLAAKVWAVGAGWFVILVIIGATFAICEGFGHMLSAWLISRTDVPEESRERISRFFPAALVLWAFSFCLTYMLRTATGSVADVLDPLASAILAGLGITTVALIGVGFATYHLYGWSSRELASYSQLRDQHNRISSLVQVNEPPATGQSAGPKIAAMILAGAIGAACCGTMHAQMVGCTFTDYSSSVSPEARANALVIHKRVIPEAFQGLDLSSWCFVRFSSDGWTAPPFDKARALTDISGACAPPTFEEIDKLSTFSRDRRIKRAAQNCSAAKRQSALEIQNSIAAIIDAMLRQNGPQSSPCTAVLDSIDRIARTASIAAATVVTDGRETCDHSHRKIPAPSHRLQLIVVLVASTKDTASAISAGNLFDQRKAELIKSAPWITVVPWFDFTKQAFSGTDPASLARK